VSVLGKYPNLHLGRILPRFELPCILLCIDQRNPAKMQTGLGEQLLWVLQALTVPVSSHNAVHYYQQGNFCCACKCPILTFNSPVTLAAIQLFFQEGQPPASSHCTDLTTILQLLARYLLSLAPSMKSSGAFTLLTWWIGDTSRNVAS